MKKPWIGIAALCLTASFGGVSLRAASTTDEVELKAEEQRIDRETAATPAPDKQTALADQFGVPVTTVQNLRSKSGWGGVTIRLAMAQQLQAADPTTYPTMDAALAKIDTLRAQNMGWGKMAQELGFKLGPVVSAAQHARHHTFGAPPMGRAEQKKLQSEPRGPKTDRPNAIPADTRPNPKADVPRPERPAHVDHPTRIDRPAHPEHPTHPQGK